MNARTFFLAAALAVALATTGCAVQRGQQTVGGYVDDAAITAQVKSSFVSNKEVGAASISVETLEGKVMLSGFAKNEAEKTAAGRLAQTVKGVKSVENQIVVQP
jgi:hyperosmotically inducible periplasmic protein